MDPIIAGLIALALLVFAFLVHRALDFVQETRKISSKIQAPGNNKNLVILDAMDQILAGLEGIAVEQSKICKSMNLTQEQADKIIKPVKDKFDLIKGAKENGVALPLLEVGQDFFKNTLKSWFGGVK
jgi:hypothetical protein